MKQKRVLTFALVCLMLFAQLPFSAFAEETGTKTADIRAELLSPDTLPDGRVEVKYNKDFYFDYSKFNDGLMWYSWSVDDGELPPGLELVGRYSTWEPALQGTPTKAGTYTFTIEGGRTDYKNGEYVRTIAARKTYTMTILPAYPLEIENNNLYHGCESSPYSGPTLEEEHNRSVNWSLALADGTELPEGLSIGSYTNSYTNKTTYRIVWQSPKAGKYNLKITAAREGESVSKVLKLIIEPGSGCTHTNTTHKERKHATCQENGLADYWYCDTCEQYFVNEKCTRGAEADSLDKFYTIGFHSDKNDDGKCDACGKTMPIFKKVTSEDEITSGGMYLVVSKIGDKYYTFKALEKSYVDSIEAVEITPNSDGTFSYPKSNSGVMVLKTEFAADCGGDLDAGLQRYSFETTIDDIPYGFQTDYTNIMLDSYMSSKYGYYIKLTEDKYAEIASVYSAYWGENGWDGRYIFSAVEEETENDATDVKFCLTESEAERLPIELYKLTYTGNANGQNYTLSDGLSVVDEDEEFTVVGSDTSVINDYDSQKASTAGGIGEAVKTSYVESVISKQTAITGDVSVTTYAAISLASETVTTDEGENKNISSLVYNVTPMLKLKGTNSTDSTEYTEKIENNNINGKVTLSLCVGSMNPAQIIHHKADGTKEYFYKESSEELKPGQKTFSLDEGSNTDKGTTGNFVTFEVDSFSSFEILATAKEEPITAGNATVTPPVGGQTPSFEAVSDDPTRYSVELLYWTDVENNKDFGLTDLSNINSPYYNYKFKAGKKYYAVVKFTAVGDYELSYSNNFTINGKETWWTLNGLNRGYTFTAETPSATAAVSGNTFTVTGSYIDGCTVVLALYKKDSSGIGKLVECQTAVYNGASKTFTAKTTDYSYAKVMVWNNLESMTPIAEVVNLTQ